MLWIALYLPELSLQVSHRGLLPDLPLVVSDGAHQRPLILAANAPAQHKGIQAGMAVAAAQALDINLVVQVRDASREQAAIHALAGWATQFTPTVTLEREGVLLEVQPSLRLFDGLSALGKRLIGGARKLGFAVEISVAPTPLAAWMLARARAADDRVRGCIAIDKLAPRLAPLPLYLFDWTPDCLDALTRLGVTSVGQCRALPRDGLMRRFGGMPLHDLDRAHGDLPDPRLCFVPPQQFFSKIELATELTNVDWLKLPIRQMLNELEGYLRARLQGTQELLLTFEQGRAVRTTVKVSLSTAQCFAEDFMLLVNEHLARTTLDAPVQAVSLCVAVLLPYEPENRTLVADGARQSMALLQLCERIEARLPPDRLYRIALNDDHRPEHAWRKDGNAGLTMDFPELPRPAWLLAQPQPLSMAMGHPQYHGSLRLLTAPERIETGWWDEHAVSRDYHVARNPSGQLCWIYRDHAQGRWYLHGLFA
ncbi:MAG: DNA polymerase Y family protein [Herminiimonas sp.]|nr:DNA polymerase Y family protein [Herminiimonas sp.]